MQVVRGLLEADEFEAEAVQGEPCRPEFPHDLGHLVRSLAAADGANTDNRLSKEIHTRRLVHAVVGHIVRQGPALQNGGNNGVAGSQIEETLYGEALVLLNGLSGSLQHEGLAHPVLTCGPVQTSNLVCPAGNLGAVLLSWRLPFAKEREFTEAPGIQCPRRPARSKPLPLDQGSP